MNPPIKTPEEEFLPLYDALVDKRYDDIKLLCIENGYTEMEACSLSFAESSKKWRAETLTTKEKVRMNVYKGLQYILPQWLAYWLIRTLLPCKGDS